MMKLTIYYFIRSTLYGCIQPRLRLESLIVIKIESRRTQAQFNTTLPTAGEGEGVTLVINALAGRVLTSSIESCTRMGL